MDRISLLLRSKLFKHLSNFSFLANKYTYNSLNNYSAKFSTTITNNERYSLIKYGTENTKDFRLYFKNEKQHLVSPFHDIPLHQSEDVLNMVVEIPRWTHAKMEINKKEKLNPIVQDQKGGKLRYIKNVHPYFGYIWNYGALPQTWDDPNQMDEGFRGDNDPLDVLELSSDQIEMGKVVQVKVLGALGLIDEGEADWKILTINVQDPLAAKLNDITDLDQFFLGVTRDWFRVYKIPAGKKENQFMNNGVYLDKKAALKIIEKSHLAWKNLLDATQNELHKKLNISIVNTSLRNHATIENEKAQIYLSETLKELEKKKPESLDALDLKEINRIFYVNRDLLN